MDKQDIVIELRMAKVYPHDISLFDRAADEIQKLRVELASVGEITNRPIDYICAVRHYDKYDSRYTFALPSQWYNLEFSNFEDYQEFQMQLVYLLGEAKKKWEGKMRADSGKKKQDA